jgi:hypothetical protein
MELLEKTNKAWNWPVIQTDMVVLATDHEKTSPTIVMMILNNQYSGSCTFDDVKKTFPVFSLYSKSLDEVVDPSGKGLHLLQYKNYYDVTKILETMDDKKDMDVKEFWKYIKDKSFAKDIFESVKADVKEDVKGEDEVKDKTDIKAKADAETPTKVITEADKSKTEKPPIEFITDTVTKRLLITKYWNKPVIFTMDGETKVLGVMVLQEVKKETIVYSADEELMLNSLNHTFLGPG